MNVKNTVRKNIVIKSKKILILLNVKNKKKDEVKNAEMEKMEKMVNKD